MELNNAKITVTGGAGYIGNILVPMLLDLGAQVTVIDDLILGQSAPDFSDRIKFIKQDLRAAGAIEEAIREADAIIHLAAIVGEPACRKNPIVAREINVALTERLNALRGDTPLLYFSSTSIYGETSGGTCDEQFAPIPETPYARDKWASEQIIAPSDNWIIFRPATAFGTSARQRLDILINELAYSAVKDGKIKLFNPDLNRTFVHVRDLSAAAVWALQNFSRLKNNAYNVGSDRMNVSKRRIGELLQEKIGCAVEIIDGGADPDKRNFIVNYGKITDAGWSAVMDLEQGLTEMISKFKEFTADTTNYNTNYDL